MKQSEIRAALILPVIFLLLRVSLAQQVSEEFVLRGYYHHDDSTTFLFDPVLYSRPAPDRVAVTGSFRGWSQNDDDPAWQLSPLPGSTDVWRLTVLNRDFSSIPAGSEFKFRVDDGAWMTPPAHAPNLRGGNLSIAAPSIRAEIRSSRAIWVTSVDLDQSLSLPDYRLTTGYGQPIEIEAILPNTSTEALLVPVPELDVRRVYYLERIGFAPTLVRRDPWFRTLYSGKPLGAEIVGGGQATTFRIFAPRAERVQLFLYLNPGDRPEDAAKVIELTPDASGVWETTEDGDHHGVYYDFRVFGPPDPGNFFYETHPVQVTDPYARVSVDSFGKNRVWRPARPAAPLAGGRPAMEDVIAYEVHVQDFTDLLPVSDVLKGTFQAMRMADLTNSHGAPIGFDYLVDLGINVVHLMPVQEFLHYPDDEWQDAFGTDPYMIEQGIDRENYQWGYRTTHAFAIETRYGRRDSDYGAERDQFRDLVDAFHKQGIAVIMDIAPNHTGENMDGRNYLFNFNVLDRPYYYRTDDDLNHIGPFGNEVKSEDRPMVQRWIIDQCRHLVEEFGIDGFRIDLAGQIDEQTLNKLKSELPEDLIIFGEPWIAPSDPAVTQNPDWSWYKSDAPITFFQDDARNAFKGPVSNPADKKTDRGFAGGNGSVREQVMQGLLNSFPEEMAPSRGINYLDIHDNWTLADRFARENWDGRMGVEEDRFKVAAGLLMTSLGPIVLHGGTEMMRSKGMAPLEELVKRTASGEIAIHGKRDSYNLRNANHFVWENVGVNSDSPGVRSDYASMIDYWRGLIAFRQSDVGKVFRIGERPPPGYYEWILPENDRLLGYVVAGRVLVLVNVDDQRHLVSLPALTEGEWVQIGDGAVVDPVSGIPGAAPIVTDGSGISLEIPARAMHIWVRSSLSETQ
jgi:pullulanase/glycogen debranching enzyme